MSNPAQLASYIEQKLGYPLPIEQTTGRDGYNEIVNFLKAMDIGTRRELYNGARRHILSASPSQYSKHLRQLWWFSHPSFEIFDLFLANDHLVHAFISYVFAVARCSGRKGNTKGKLRSELHKSLTLKRFIDPYLDMIRVAVDPRGRLRLGPTTKLTPSNSLYLVCMTMPTEADIKNAYVSYFTTWAKAEMKTAIRNRQNKSSLQLAALLGETSYEAGALLEGTASMVEKKLPRLCEVLGVPQVKYVGGDYGSVVAPGVREKVYQVMTGGSWIRFLSLKVDLGLEIPSPPHKESVTEGALAIIREDITQQIRPWRQTKHGLLPVGLKVHALKRTDPLPWENRNSTSFQIEVATNTLVLPPVGNVDAALSLLDIVGAQLGETILNNENYQIQVCSPCRLHPELAAYLGTAFYLGSDRLRNYDTGVLRTSHDSETGKRLVIYGAGVCDGNFSWRQSKAEGGQEVEKLPRSIFCRTDVLWCHSRRDLENVNLVATLLVHDQLAGYWKPLAETFKEGLRSILEQHQLLGALVAPWVKANSDRGEGDQQFAEMFQELSAYAFCEVDRVNHTPGPTSSILQEVFDLLHYCHQTVRSE